jgi:hypothetical protein
MRPIRFVLILFLLVPNSQTCAQQWSTLSQNDYAEALLQASYASLSGGQPINDVIIRATITNFKNNEKDQQQGTAVLTAVGSGQSQVTLSLPSGNFSEIRNVSQNSATGTGVSANNVTRNVDPLDLQTRPAAWFFPALTLAPGSGSSDYSASLVAREFKYGVYVEHIAFRPAAGYSPAFPGSGKTHVYLDASSKLPVAIAFKVSARDPRNNVQRSMPAEIHFFDYRQVGSRMVPHRIQVSVGQHVYSDIQVSTVSINTGAVVSGSK